MITEGNSWSRAFIPDRVTDRKTTICYDRSCEGLQVATIDRTIGRWSPPLIAWLPTIDLAIDLLQSLVIVRPRIPPIVRWSTTSLKSNHNIRPLLEIVANIADQKIVRSGVTGALCWPPWKHWLIDGSKCMTGGHHGDWNNCTATQNALWIIIY